MRFHKATQITRVEADFIIETAQESLNDLLVLNHFDDWFDVRRMTENEVRSFLDDLMRADLADIEAGRAH
jgi:hypothetical protein